MLTERYHKDSQGRPWISIFINDEPYGSFRLSLWKKGQGAAPLEKNSSSLEELHQALKKIERKGAMAYAIAALSIGNRPQSWLLKKMDEQGVSKEVALTIALEMSERGFSSDTLAAEHLTARAKQKGRGPLWLKAQQRLKGVSCECSLSHEEELEQLRILLAKEPCLGKDFKAKQRLCARLQRRGFHFDAISQAVSEII